MLKVVMSEYKLKSLVREFFYEKYQLKGNIIQPSDYHTLEKEFSNWITTKIEESELPTEHSVSTPFVGDLKLKREMAYTVYSSDNEVRSSEKGIYKNRDIAYKRSLKSGWYGSNGEVREKTVYKDANGEIYEVKKIGRYTDQFLDFSQEPLINSIKSKLTQEELEFLGYEKPFLETEEETLI